MRPLTSEQEEFLNWSLHEFLQASMALRAKVRDGGKPYPEIDKWIEQLPDDVKACVLHYINEPIPEDATLAFMENRIKVLTHHILLKSTTVEALEEWMTVALDPNPIELMRKAKVFTDGARSQSKGHIGYKTSSIELWRKSKAEVTGGVQGPSDN